MPRGNQENPAVRQFLIAALAKGPGNIVAAATQKFGLSRNAINRYLTKLLREGVIEAKGETKGRKYNLKESVDVAYRFEVKGLEEDVVWREFISAHLENLPKNVISICRHGVTEMVNNVIDHSESENCRVRVRVNAARIQIIVRDWGVGIFEKIKEQCKLHDPRHALLELSKGKLTTAPGKHSGEGIFFTSRIFDLFEIRSGYLYYTREIERDSEDDDDWLVEVEDKNSKIRGTMVWMQLSRNATRTVAEVLDTYAKADGDYGFSRTHVPVALALYGNDQLVSRSQAKRVLARFERFKEVMLDFYGVPEIGQAFADEIFRVYRQEHPEVTIISARTTPEVQKMIDWVQSQNQNPSNQVSQA